MVHNLQMEMSRAVLRQIKLISLALVEHQDSLRNSDKQQLRNLRLKKLKHGRLDQAEKWSSFYVILFNLHTTGSTLIGNEWLLLLNSGIKIS